MCCVSFLFVPDGRNLYFILVQAQQAGSYMPPFSHCPVYLHKRACANGQSINQSYENMQTYKLYLTALALLPMGACTSLSEGQQELPPAPVNERVTLRSDPTQTLRQRMDNNASEINRKRNIEQFDSNKPAMTPNALRPRTLPYAPIDSSRHFIYWPLRPVVRPLPPTIRETNQQ